MSLSVCVVTRDHESSLPRVLRSVAGLADDVLVLDTGSTDGTLRVAAEAGARTASFAWDDDFAAACNAAVAEARGVWILLLNPDEELLPTTRDVVQSYLKRDGIFAYHLRVREMLRPDQPPPFVETSSPRLFRRHDELRYVGRLYPHFATPLEDVASFQGRGVDFADLTLLHHAYLSVPTDDKLRWAVRLLEKELADRPGQLHYQIEYGLHLNRLRDPKAHDALAVAAANLATARDQERPPHPSAARLLEYLLTVSPELSRARVSREDAAALALRWFPDAPVLLWRVAEVAFQAGDFPRAAHVLEHLVEVGRSGAYDRSTPFDPALIGSGALLNLGTCRLRLGQLDAAEQVLRLVPPGSPHHGRALQELAMVARRRAASPSERPSQAT